MSARIVAATGTAILAVFVTCGGLLAAVFGGVANTGCTTTTDPNVSLAVGRPSPTPGGYPGIGVWNGEAVGNAATIITVGAELGVPVRGRVIAVATAMRESSLINLPDLGEANNADSLGLFQQRPSQGWGTPTQITDPVHAATTFYQHLLAVPGWQTMPLNQAAQAVQRSAAPGYAQWEPDATRIVTTLATPADLPALAGACDPTTMVAPPPGFSLPAGTPPAVVTAIWWAFAQLGTPYSFGGDCTAAHSGDRNRQCDCSSLVQQAYAAAGTALPRGSVDQSHTGVPVPGVDQLQPGDLVFTPGADGTMSAPGHVGMYLGSGLIIAAPTDGQVVHLEPLRPYWTDNLAGIRRITPAAAVGSQKRRPTLERDVHGLSHGS